MKDYNIPSEFKDTLDENNNFIDIINLFIRQGYSIKQIILQNKHLFSINDVDSEGTAPIFCALSIAEKMDVQENIKIIVNTPGYNPNQRNKIEESTPAIIAARNGTVEIIETVCFAKDVDLTATNKLRLSLVDSATLNLSPAAYVYLMEKLPNFITTKEHSIHNSIIHNEEKFNTPAWIEVSKKYFNLDSQSPIVH